MDEFTDHRMSFRRLGENGIQGCYCGKCFKVYDEKIKELSKKVKKNQGVVLEDETLQMLANNILNKSEQFWMSIDKDFVKTIFEEDPKDKNNLKLCEMNNPEIQLQFVKLKNELNSKTMYIPGLVYLEHKNMVCRSFYNMLNDKIKREKEGILKKLEEEKKKLSLVGDKIVKDINKFDQFIKKTCEKVYKKIKDMEIRFELKKEEEQKMYADKLSKMEENLEKINKKCEEKLLCQICYENPIDSIASCGHARFCRKCLAKLLVEEYAKCPFCKRAIDSITKIIW